MKVLHVVGARPNFMKVAPVIRALGHREGVHQVLVHTGQHYDSNMSAVFFQELGIPTPDLNLGVGSGSHAEQTSDIIRRFEPVILRHRPDLVMVYGDVNSTVAATLVCAKLLVPVAHVEAGLRSFDRGMPEEINRLLTDQISDLMFTPSQDGNDNLQREGVADSKVHLVGNVMIDTLIHLLPQAAGQIPDDLPERFALVTLHRPSNVDDVEWLESLLAVLGEVSHDLPVIFPVHPRTRSRIASTSFLTRRVFPDLQLVDPAPYLRFLALEMRATAVITDSGGIQEETTYLGIPCLTMRENTERPVTVSLGTNVLIGRDVDLLQVALRRVLDGKWKHGTIPPLWDGHAAERIAGVLTGSPEATAAAEAQRSSRPLTAAEV